MAGDIDKINEVFRSHDELEKNSTYAEKKLLDINDCIQGFSCCDFLSCSFTDCSLNQLFFSIGTLKCVEFNITSMSSVIFQMNAFSQVKFVGNCKLHDFLILSPSKAAANDTGIFISVTFIFIFLASKEVATNLS